MAVEEFYKRSGAPEAAYVVEGMNEPGATKLLFIII